MLTRDLPKASSTQPPSLPNTPHHRIQHDQAPTRNPRTCKSSSPRSTASTRHATSLDAAATVIPFSHTSRFLLTSPLARSRRILSSCRPLPLPNLQDAQQLHGYLAARSILTEVHLDLLGLRGIRTTKASGSGGVAPAKSGRGARRGKNKHGPRMNGGIAGKSDWRGATKVATEAQSSHIPGRVERAEEEHRNTILPRDS